MITLYTSVTCPWSTIVDVATRDMIDHVSCHEGCAAILYQEEPHLLPSEQATWGDKIIAKHRVAPKRRHVIATTSELCLLRILRRIRETTEWKMEATSEFLPSMEHDPERICWLRAEELEVRCITMRHPTNGKPYTQRLRVLESGSFADPWPDGFFDERMKELF